MKVQASFSSSPSAASARSDHSVLMYFLGFILLSGGGPVAMRISFLELPPFLVSFIRFGFAAAIFWGLAIINKIRVPKGRALAGSLIYGILSFGISFAFLSWGLVKTPASLGAVFLALIPMMTVILSALEGVERLSLRNILGSALSLVGMLVAVGAASSSNEISVIRIGALILGVIFLAQGSVVIKRYPVNPPIITNALAMSAGAVFLVGASLIAGEAWVIPSRAGTWVALAYLVFFVSMTGNLLFLKVLNKWTASGTSYGFVVMPFITAIISAVLTRELITLNFLFGMVLVVAGVIFGALLPHKENVAAECAAC